jgi:hypothetical protein
VRAASPATRRNGKTEPLRTARSPGSRRSIDRTGQAFRTSSDDRFRPILLKNSKLHSPRILERVRCNNSLGESSERSSEGSWSHATEDRVVPHVRGEAAPLWAWNFSSSAGKGVFQPTDRLVIDTREGRQRTFRPGPQPEEPYAE